MQSGEANMPQNPSDLPLSQEHQLRTSKKNNDQDEYQTPDGRCKGIRVYRKGKKTKKNKREFLWNKICRGQEDKKLRD
jgi:hypothetical protein